MSHANMDAMVSLCKFSLLKFMIPHIPLITHEAVSGALKAPNFSFILSSLLTCPHLHYYLSCHTKVSFIIFPK